MTDRPCATCVHVRKSFLSNPDLMKARDWHCRYPDPHSSLACVTGKPEILERPCTEERSSLGRCGKEGARHEEGEPTFMWIDALTGRKFAHL